MKEPSSVVISLSPSGRMWTITINGIDDITVTDGTKKHEYKGHLSPTQTMITFEEPGNYDGMRVTGMCPDETTMDQIKNILKKR